MVTAFELADGLRPLYYDKLHQYFGASGDALTPSKLLEILNIVLEEKLSESDLLKNSKIK